MKIDKNKVIYDGNSLRLKNQDDDYLIANINKKLKKPQVIKAYLCTTDWNTYLPLGAQNVKIYTSLKALKRSCTCYKECGITQIEITKKKTVQKGTNRW